MVGPSHFNVGTADSQSTGNHPFSLTITVSVTFSIFQFSFRSVKLVRGKARFSRIRVSKPADKLKEYDRMVEKNWTDNQSSLYTLTLKDIL